MKKVMLIGKLNATVNELNNLLSQYLILQLCSEDPSAVPGMMRIVKPDLVIISLVGGAAEIDISVFRLLSTNYPNIPVLTIGNDQERAPFMTYYKDIQFRHLSRPISSQQVLEAAWKTLGLGDKIVPLDTGEDGSGRPKVLVVDDDPVTLRAVKGMLDSEFDVILATSGTKAIATMGRKRPDVVLLDYEMPVVDGKQTLEMIRSEEELKDLPVIFLTGKSDRAHIHSVLALRPAGYILKPAERENLIASIRKAIEIK